MLLVIAASRVHCAVESKPLTHLDCRRSVALRLLKSPIKSRLQIGGGRIAVLLDNVRYDAVDHIKVSAPQGRCKNCQTNTRFVSKM